MCARHSVYIENLPGTATPKLKYTGSMKNGLFEGRGKLETFWPNGMTGDVYEGELRNGELEGEGVKTLFDQDGQQLARHEGVFHLSTPNGVGTLYGQEALPLDRGVFANGRLEGPGERWSYHPDKSISAHYQGVFAEGEYSGEGELCFFRGGLKRRCFKGQFRDGRPAVGVTTYYQDGEPRCDVEGPPARNAQCSDGSTP